MNDLRRQLLADFVDYAVQYPDESATAREFAGFLGSDASVFERAHAVGHFTGSAWLVSADGRRVLLTHHRKLDRWLQPGGHYEDAPAFHHSAMREAEEETGVTRLTLHPWHRQSDLPFVIDSHDVPGKASRNEPPHIHHDLQYLFVADPALPLVAQLEEVNAAQWCDASRLAEFAPKAVDRLSTVAALG